MRRRNFIKTTAGLTALGTVGLAGCTGSATGRLATRVSDQPGDIDDFESLVVHITGIWVKPADGDLTKKDIDEATADLTELQGDASALVETVELPAGEYEYLQLKISETEATLKDGGTATVEVPGEAPLKFDHSFEIRDGQTTTFTADFTPVKRGQAGGYVLQPVADEVTVTYEGETTTTATATSG